MRKYILQFMEQRIGIPRLTKLAGPAGEIAFEAVDDDAALSYVAEHLLQRLRSCERAELSSMAIVPDADCAAGVRVVDDSLEHPHFHEMHLRLNPHTGKLELDFGSTTVSLASTH